MIWVEAEVFERQSAYVKKGTPVTMTIDYLPGEKWQGIVDYVHSDELPGWRGERPVRFELDGQRFGEEMCRYRDR